jgi:hypothetical protein
MLYLDNQNVNLVIHSLICKHLFYQLCTKVKAKNLTETAINLL